MALTLYLLRHGETTFSQSGQFCGMTDAPLTPEGRQMAEAFAEHYQALAWQAVFISPMLRTRETAEPLCQVTGITPEIREGLREISYGRWEAQTQAYAQQNHSEEYHKWLTDPAWNPPTEGESGVQVANRAMPVIAEIEAKYMDGNVLLVSHKATIRIILCCLIGIDIGRYRDRIDAPAASLSIIRFGKYGPLLETLGDRGFMPEHLRQRSGT